MSARVPRPLVIAMSGLPGSGKTTLSRELARAIGALRWDKDELRQLLFPPAAVPYSRPLNDLCMELLYTALRHVAGHRGAHAPVVILDGRPFGEADQRARVEAAAREANADLVFISCTAPLELLRERIASEAHPAPDRDDALLDRLAQAAAPWGGEAIVVDTSSLGPAEAAALCLRELNARGLLALAASKTSDSHA